MDMYHTYANHILGVDVYVCICVYMYIFMIDPSDLVQKRVAPIYLYRDSGWALRGRI